ncbi:MAG: M48 family metallopeptidase [Candidatus Hydrogenedens sp.]|jgi:hypothetical protein|nr:M48 family metallopeptidase [Candidatus Hydrogenedens sp.]
MSRYDTTGQLEFDWERSQSRPALSPVQQAQYYKRLQASLEEKTGLVVELTITDNQSRMISFKREPSEKKVSLRLHHMFLEAPDPVIRDLVHWILHPRSKKYPNRFQAFIDENSSRIRRTAVRGTTRVRGEIYDLEALYKEINRDSFNNRVTAGITWGRHTKGRTRSICLGNYRRTEHMIRIHPRLDQDFVPLFVIRHIIYHEMLHSLMPVERNARGQRRVHSAAFNREERKSPDFEAAEAWLEKSENLDRLLKRSRSSRG